MLPWGSAPEGSRGCLLPLPAGLLGSGRTGPAELVRPAWMLPWGSAPEGSRGGLLPLPAGLLGSGRTGPAERGPAELVRPNWSGRTGPAERGPAGFWVLVR